MRNLNKFGLMVAMAFATVACVDQDPEIHDFPDADVDFTYEVAEDEYTVDYYVVSKIQFINKSEKIGKVTWNFDSDNVNPEIVNYDIIDEEDINQPIVKYRKAGLYNISLTIEATDGEVYKKSYPILIYDITPIMFVEDQTDSIAEINKTKIKIGLKLPNPENYDVVYEWTFPEGTTFDDAKIAEQVSDNKWIGYGKFIDGEYKIDNPGYLTFKNIGSQPIVVKTRFDVEDKDIDGDGVFEHIAEDRQLEDKSINVQVGCDVAAPTLYYAVKDGNIKALKLIDTSAAKYKDTKVLPFDMGVSSGSMPKNLCYGSYDGQQYIYILDAGKQYYFIDDANSVAGDGKITAMGVDGSNVNVVVSNEGQQAFMDPYFGFVYGSDLYYSDRNYGISKIALKERGKLETQSESDKKYRADYFVINNLIPYYNKTIIFGSVTCGIHRDSKGVWWWGKNYNGLAILRFTEKDIYATEKEAAKAKNPYEPVLDGVRMSTFAVDEKQNALYVWRTNEGKHGFYHVALPGDTEKGNIDAPLFSKAMNADPVNTTAEEGVHVTQFAVDSKTGCVYFCYRKDKQDNSGFDTGVLCYNPKTKELKPYGETKDDAGYGVTINPTLSKLF